MSDREKKEPGQLAYEAYNSGRQWGGLWTVEREAWAHVEAAIYEDAAKIAEGWRRVWNGDAAPIANGIASSIRAKIGKSR